MTLPRAVIIFNIVEANVQNQNTIADTKVDLDQIQTCQLPQIPVYITYFRQGVAPLFVEVIIS